AERDNHPTTGSAADSLRNRRAHARRPASRAGAAPTCRPDIGRRSARAGGPRSSPRMAVVGLARAPHRRNPAELVARRRRCHSAHRDDDADAAGQPTLLLYSNKATLCSIILCLTLYI